MKTHPYQMRCHLLFALAALFLLCCWIPLSSAQAQSQTSISKFPFQESFQMFSSETRFYRLVLANAPKGLDLLISVVPDQGSYSPKLFVSNNKESPEKMNDADYSSIRLSRNDVLISHKDLKDTSNFLFIGLLCASPKCSAKIFTEWTKEIQVIANGDKAIQNSKSLDGALSALVRLVIPKEDDAERIVIHVDAITAFKKETPFLEVFINQGLSIPFTNTAENIPRKSSWLEGSTIVIEKDSSLFCTDCLLTLSLNFAKFSSISVQAQTYKKNMFISGKAELDGVQKGKENSYRFTGRESYKEEDFVLSVKVHQGKVRVFVDCGTQPQSSANYYWSYLAENSKDIVLSHKERSHCSNENYFILVQGEESSAYSLHTTYRRSNQLFMGKASPVRDEISPQEKVTYEIIIPLFVAEEITLDLRYKESLDFNVNGCRFFTDCPGLLPAGSQHKITNYYGFDNSLDVGKLSTYHSEDIPSGGRLVKINPREFGCYPLLIQDQRFTKEPVPVCAYLVTISNQQPSSVEYTLTAEYKGPTLLSISEPKFDVVTKQNSLYYVLSVPRQKEAIESIQIQLTKLSGDVDVFVSKSNKSPNKQSDNDAITFSYEGFIVINGRFDLSGAYYIGVHGLETSSFSLSATIQPRTKMTEDSAWLLNPGQPQKGVLLPKHQYQAQYYKILLNQGEDWKGILRITVNSFTGRVLIVVNNNGEFPTADKNMWEDNHHALGIYSNDFDFKKQGLYYVGIYVDMTAPEAEQIADLTYYITYSLVDNLPNPVHMFLSPNTPFFGEIKKGEINYFEALIPAEQFPLTIYKQSDEGKIDLYISRDAKNKYPSQDSYTLTTKDSITLEACEAAASLTCPVYITVSSTVERQATSSYSLSMSSSDPSVVALENDRQIQSKVPINNSPATFYYHAIPSKQSVITVSCPGREVTIYAKRIKINLNSRGKPGIQSLDEKTAEFTSEKGVTYVSVPALGGSDITIVVVSVYFKETSQEGESTTFKILASSQVTQLYTGTPYTGFIEKDHYMYFMLNVMRSECTLLISLTNLDKEGDADLVISYGQNTRPTTTHHQFAYLSDKKTEIIEISKTDLSSSDSMSGNWIFGVYGYTASSFNLTVVYEEQKMVDLKPGVPAEMSLKESSFVYLNFLHQSPRNLQINLTKFSGQLNLYMTSIDLNEDLVANLPDQAHHKWQITRSNPQSVITIPMQDHQACVSCIYLINIEAISSCRFSLGVIELDDIVPIQDGLQYKGRLKSQELAVFMLKKSDNPKDEGQLAIEMKGNELDIMGSHDSTINLTNYLWQETLTVIDPGHVISLKKFSESLTTISENFTTISDAKEDPQRDSYYILLYNPKNWNVDYSFTMTTKSPEIFFGEHVERIYDLDPFEKNYFVYNSTGSSGISAEITFYAVRNKAEDIQAFMEAGLRQGQKLNARYWPEKSTAGLGEEVALEAESGPKARSNSSHIIVEQKFSIKDPKGKYMVEVVNPWEFPVRFRLFMRPYHVEKKTVDHYSNGWWNTHDVLRSENPKFYTVNMESRGNWYLWVYSCSPTMDLKVEDGDLETGMVTIPKGESYFYKESIEKDHETPKETEPKRRYDIYREREAYKPKSLVMSVNANSLSEQGKFIMYSAEVDEERSRNYDIKENHLELDITYKPQKEDKNEVTVEFRPIELRDPEAWTHIAYNVWLCPDISKLAFEDPLCSGDLYSSRCKEARLDSMKDQGERVKVKFQDVNYGIYFVKIKATIQEQMKAIKIVQPYVVGYVNVNNPIFWKIFKIFIVVEILVVLVVVGFKGYKKFKVRQENKGLELQKVENSMKGYNPLKDGETSTEGNSGDNSEVNNVSSENQKAEQSECRVIEMNDEE